METPAIELELSPEDAEFLESVARRRGQTNTEVIHNVLVEFHAVLTGDARVLIDCGHGAVHQLLLAWETLRPQ